MNMPKRITGPLQLIIIAAVLTSLLTGCREDVAASQYEHREGEVVEVDTDKGVISVTCAPSTMHQEREEISGKLCYGAEIRQGQVTTALDDLHKGDRVHVVGRWDDIDGQREFVIVKLNVVDELPSAMPDSRPASNASQ
jgi:hypothetical protein